ncbi:hypothetical protein M885DRAFT_554740 [Pelagophyceae sp. CCMP2097]|nr:hypothetical protein M885DRAFT_554740 [Pelagophyceae sp. CCMP2097]
MASRAEAQARRWAARSTAPGARAAPSPSPEPPSLPEPRRASADEAALWAAELAARLGGARCDAWDPLERAAGLPPDAARGFDVFDAATAESLSYACVAARARRLGTWLSTIGIDAGSVVALVGCNSAAALVAHFAVAGWLGAVVLNANPRLAADELAYILDMAQAKGLLADKAQGALVDSVLASAPSVRCVVWTNVPPEAWLHVGDEYLLRDRDVIVTEYLSIVAGPDGAADAGAASTARRKGAVAGCDNAACEMYFTSGTTGRPKGVVLSRRAVVLHALGCVVEHRLGAGDVWLHAAPMFHLVDAYAIFAVTWVGGRHVTLPRFGGAAFASAVEAHGITVTNVAATMVMLVLADPAAAAADLRSLQLVSCGGAPLSRETVLRAVERFGCEFFLSYGMTECCGKISMSLVDAETRRRCGAAEVLDLVCTSGRHFSLLEVRVLAAGDGDAVDVSPSERGGAVGPEHVGEVWIRGPTLFRGYFGDAAATAEAITPQGWFRTGDVATVNARGYLTITDRAKDMILVGSENVYCVEVERVLHDHAAVEHAAVYGVPDALLGERVKAVVVAAGADISASALRSHVPSIIEFIDAADLPMTASGKVAKAKLKRRDEARRRDDEARRRDEARALSWRASAAAPS